MKIIKENITNQIEIKKSTFITNCFYVENEEDINKYLNEIRKKYYDARHNCFSYVIGTKNQILKQSDDGEPKGTAGLPILNSLKLKEITNCLVIITRYFGGVLLGASGLFRAYSDSANMILENVEKSEIISGFKIDIDINYSDYQILNNYVMNNKENIIQLDIKFLEMVRITYLVYEIKKEELINYIKNITKDKAIIKINDKINFSKFNKNIKYIFN